MPVGEIEHVPRLARPDVMVLMENIDSKDLVQNRVEQDDAEGVARMTVVRGHHANEQCHQVDIALSEQEHGTGTEFEARNEINGVEGLRR